MVFRALATAWAGGLSLTAVWVASPLLGAASAAQPELPEGNADAALQVEFARSFVPVPPAGDLGPSVGWRTPGQADAELAQVQTHGWLTPDWYPAGPDALALGEMNAPGPTSGPHVKSRSVFVYDIDAGRVLYEKNPDTVRPVASITKLVSALALASAEPDLERELCIGAEQYPTRSGAPSRLSTGDCLSGWDLLGAALVASDNRAAMGLAGAADMHLDEFIGRMNRVSVELGMTHSSWIEPSGLEDENLSTARDIAKATVAVANHPMLSSVASAPHWDIWRSNRTDVRRLFSTDRLSGREDLSVEAAKTGYTDTARYCFTTVLRTASGRRLAVTLLGADGKMTRWADMSRILTWAEST